MNRAQVDKLRIGDRLHYTGVCQATIGPRGSMKLSMETWRVNGKLQTWKTRPEEFRLPIKYGLKTCDEINHRNMRDFHLESECTVLNCPPEIMKTMPPGTYNEGDVVEFQRANYERLYGKRDNK